MIVVGGVLTCLAGIMHFIIMIDDVVRDREAIYVVLGFTGGFLVLAGIFIALGYAKISKFQDEMDRMKRKINQ